ncbi:MAG: hypothetical protein AAFQ82_19215, partial [Myxococcota bacterium]
DPRSELSACERYPPDGTRALAIPLIRGTLDDPFGFVFTVTDAAIEQRSGSLVSDSFPLAPGRGASPSGVYVGDAPRLSDERATFLFITYEATDTLLIIRPDLPVQISEPDYEVLN